MSGEREPDGPERASADLTKSQGSPRSDTANRGPLEEQDVGVFEGEDQHGWAPDVDPDREETDRSD
jgi:hypothetical protein